MTTKDQKEFAQSRIMATIAGYISQMIDQKEDNDEIEAITKQAIRVGKLFGYTSFPGIGKFDKKIVKFDNNYELELE